MGSGIMYNVVARAANTLNERQQAILENDTEKQVILNKEEMRSAETCEDASKQSDSERVKRLDEMVGSGGLWRVGCGHQRVEEKD